MKQLFTFHQTPPSEKTRRMFPLFLMALCLALFAAACQTTTPGHLPELPAAAEGSSQLTEGDVVQITFPGATNLSTKQTIRRDGTINLPLIGDIKAAQKTLPDLQKEVSEVYKPHLQSQEVNVALVSSTVPVYVTGAVLRPGKVVTDRAITALEAIMEAGGFNQERANMRKVVVIRYVNGERVGHTIDLESATKGGKSKDTTLQPNDIVFVPEKLQLF